jgi:hypothetical protein
MMMSTFFLLTLSIILLPYTVSFYDYISIKRTLVKAGLEVLTLKPQGVLSQTKWTRYPATNKIKEIIYLPSLLCINPCDKVDISSLEDDHFCGMLNESGFTVHIVCSQRIDDNLVRDIIQWKKDESNDMFAIIAQEFSSSSLLRYLGNVSDPSLDFTAGLTNHS